MIYIATMAYREAYREYSIKLIESVRKHIQGCKIIVATDDVAFYDEYKGDDLHIFEGPICNYEPYFKANLKSYALDGVLSFIQNDDIVIFLDADCYVVKDLHESMFDIIGYGLSLPMGSDYMDKQITPDEVHNIIVRTKILKHNPDRTQKYHVFREAFLLFRVNQTFIDFVHEWTNIYQESLVKRIDNASVTFDIQCAMHRSGLPLNNIEPYSPFANSIYTITISGGESQMM